MEISLDKARDYILALKEVGNFTLEDMANMSGIPLSTIRNICSGKTPDARFGTIAKLLREDKLFVADAKVDWMCLNCGNIINTEKAPSVCPVCSHARGYFVRLAFAPYTSR